MATDKSAFYETRLNRLTLFLLVVLAVLSVTGALLLPDRIPVHFNIAGHPDRYGSPAALLVLPALGLAINGLLWATRNVPPELMNFPGPRTPDNVARQMQNIRQLTATLRLLISVSFLLMQANWIWSALHPGKGWAFWPLLLSLLLLGGIVPFIVRAYRMAAKA